MIVADLGAAAEVANRWAPEHLQVAVDPEYEQELVDRLDNT